MGNTYYDELRAERVGRAERAAYYEGHRTEPDFWIRRAEAALQWGPAEKVVGYLLMARYYRDGGQEGVQVARQVGV